MCGSVWYIERLGVVERVSWLQTEGDIYIVGHKKTKESFRGQHLERGGRG